MPKIRRGMKVWVHVDPKQNPEMSHFDTDFWALVEGNYNQLCGGFSKDQKDNWGVCVLNKKGTKITNKISWYNTDQLTPDLSWDRNKGRDMIEAYEDRE